MKTRLQIEKENSVQKLSISGVGNMKFFWRKIMLNRNENIASRRQHSNS